MSHLLKTIEYWDQTFFLKINQDGSNSLFDTLMPFLREAIVWYPFYFFLLCFVIYHFGWRGVLWAAAFIATVCFADLLSSQILKESFGRLRPCNDPIFAPYIRVLARYKPKSFSLPSSHAVNHFAMAMFIYSTGKMLIGKWLWLVFFWAFLVCYAQIYVGVHYPIDVLGGTLIGCIIGFGVATIYNKKWALKLELIRVEK